MKKKTILIAGSSGMIGTAMIEELRGQKILKLNRNDFQRSDEDFVRMFESADLILNFAGSPVIRRWTKKNRKEILMSRIQTTNKLGLICEKGTHKSRHIVNASAIGIYPDDGIHTELSTKSGNGFMKDVVEGWEKEALKFQSPVTKVSILRIGIVLSREGGMMKRIIPIFKMGLGGTIGSGKQAFSWIHIKDLTGAVMYVLDNKFDGIFNLVSPNPSTNQVFTRELKDVLNRPAFLSLPSISLRLIYGKCADVVLGGQTALPQRLLNEDFVFKFPELTGALEDIVN